MPVRSYVSIMQDLTQDLTCTYKSYCESCKIQQARSYTRSCLIIIMIIARYPSSNLHIMILPAYLCPYMEVSLLQRCLQATILYSIASKDIHVCYQEYIVVPIGYIEIRMKANTRAIIKLIYTLKYTHTMDQLLCNSQ